MKSYTVTFLLCTLISCHPVKDITGVYNKINKGGKYIPSTLFVELNKDSTFRYGFNAGALSEMSCGNWEINSCQKKLILTSYIQDVDHIPIEVKEKREKEKEGYYTFILSEPLKTVEWSLVLNGKRYLFPSDTLLIPDSVPLDGFSIHGYKDGTYISPYLLQENINSEEYRIKDKGSNVYSIRFPSYVDYDVFRFLPVQDTLKIRRNSLIWNRDDYVKGYTLKLKRWKPRSKKK